jgi:CRP-like cAMP-binding protein
MEFLEEIEKIISLSHENKTILDHGFKTFHVKNGKMLLFAGEIEKKLRFIETGICRLYVINKAGTEYNTDFVFPGQWASSSPSFIHQKESFCFIEAMTDVTGRQIEFEELEKLYQQYDGFNYIGRRFMEEVLVAMIDRVTDFVVDSPIERYKKLSNQYPELINSIPSRHLASYIGITPESLSRLKKRLKN